MACSICRKPPAEERGEALFPFRQGGNIRGYICIPCAKEGDIYCEKHKRTHEGYNDGTHACTDCVAEELGRTSDLAQQELEAFLLFRLPPAEFQRLYAAYAGKNTSATEEMYKKMGWPIRKLIMWQLISRAHRMKKTVSEIKGKLVMTQKIDLLLPETA